MVQADIRDARATAHKLHSQCRDSNSAYKLLAGNLRRLRDALEDVEEAWDGSQPVQLNDERIGLQVANCKLVLGRIDLALQQYRCSTHRRESLSVRVIADMRMNVETATQNLRAAFGSTGSGTDFQLKLDTGIIGEVLSSKSTSATASASSVEHDRNLTKISSTWSLISSDTSNMSSTTPSRSPQAESGLEVALATDEKEVFEDTFEHLQSIPLEGLLEEEISPPNWRTPFASPDPLSIPFEDATSIILGTDLQLSPRRQRAPSQELGDRAETPTKDARPELNPTEVDEPAPVKASSPKLSEIATQRSDAPSSDASLDAQDAIGGKRDSVDVFQPQDISVQPPRLSSIMLQDVTTSSNLNAAGSATAGSTAVTTPSPIYQTLAEKDSQDISSDIAQANSTEHNLHDPSDAVDAMVGGGVGSSNDTSRIPEPPTRAPPPPPPPRPRRRQPPRERLSLPMAEAAPLAPSQRPDEVVDAADDNQRDETSPLPSSSEIHGLANPETHTKRASASSFDSMYESRTPPPRSPTDLKPAPLKPHRRAPSIPTISIDSSALKTVDRLSAAAPTERIRSNSAPSRVGSATSKLPSPARYKHNSSRHIAHSLRKGTPKPRDHVGHSTDRDNPLQHSGRSGDSPLDPPRSHLTPSRELSVTMKEVASDDGLEVDTQIHWPPKLGIHRSVRRVAHRQSADEVLRVGSMHEHPNEAARRMTIAETPNAAEQGIKEFYTPDGDYDIFLDEEREPLIIQFWNSCEWDEASAHLSGYLASLDRRNDRVLARRIRHMLGVCASCRGQWHDSLHWFLSVMRTPIRDVNELDDADCAAAFWLADTYTMLNRPLEALLAYSIAERSSFFVDPAQPDFQTVIRAEQDALTTVWPELSRRESSLQHLLDPDIVTPAAARTLLKTEPRPASRWDLPRLELTQDKSRGGHLYSRHSPVTPSPLFKLYQGLKLVPRFFRQDAPWPMMYDPLFCMANVQRGRLIGQECDLLEILEKNAEAKLLKNPSVSLARLDCFFTSNDLIWLIKTMRECLQTYEIGWSETANEKGIWFVARYSFMDYKFSTTHYFSIALFRQSFRSGFGVDIAPEGICSARVMRTASSHVKGVHISQPKRVKKLIREYLDTAATEHSREKKRDASAWKQDVISTRIPEVETNDRVSVTSTSPPPPIPPRPARRSVGS